MKVLIVIAHSDPTKKATSYKLATAAKEALEAAHNEVKVTDLIEEGFDKTATASDFKEMKEDPRFRYLMNQSEDNLIETIKKQQELITWCDHFLVIGAMYFFRFPACLYAWIERCFSFGFAFSPKHNLDNGLLKGKKVSLVITTGGVAPHFVARGYSPLEALLYSTTYAFRYCGVVATRSMGYFGINSPDVQAHQEEWIANFKKAVVKLDEWPLLPVLHGKPQEGEKNEPEIISALEPLQPEDLI